MKEQKPSDEVTHDREAEVRSILQRLLRMLSRPIAQDLFEKNSPGTKRCKKSKSSKQS